MNGESQLPDVLRIVVWVAGILYVVMSVVAGVSLLFRKESKPSHVIKETVITPRRLPPKLDDYIQPHADIVEKVDSVITSKGRLILMGRSGSGKTTFAQDICRRYGEMNGESPIEQTPVFVPLSQAHRSNGLLSMFVDQVAQSIASDSLDDPRAKAERMIKRGSLFLIIDDLDYLGRQGHNELEKFIGRWEKNSFLCIISEKPRYPFLEDFEKITMPDWQEKDAIAYIQRCIKDGVKRTELIEHLKELGTLKQPLTPWQVKFLVDAYIEGRIFKLIELRSMEDEREYKILDGYLRIVIENSGMKPFEVIRDLGGLALKLLKQGQSSFIPEKAGVKESLVRSFTPKLFQQQANAFTFVHGNYQVFLASRYLGESWSEAKADLKDSEARTLIWKAVYTCTLQFIPDSQKEDLHATFQRLSGNEVVVSKG